MCARLYSGGRMCDTYAPIGLASTGNIDTSRLEPPRFAISFVGQTVGHGSLIARAYRRSLGRWRLRSTRLLAVYR